jgi:hypothetical protein
LIQSRRAAIAITATIAIAYGERRFLAGRERR